MKRKIKQDYRERRKEEYPAIEEQLDAIWKFLAGQPIKSLPPETSKMLVRVMGVKKRFSKPVDRQNDER